MNGIIPFTAAEAYALAFADVNCHARRGRVDDELRLKAYVVALGRPGLSVTADESRAMNDVDRVLARITAATAEAHAKHGRSFEDASPELRLTIMMEELGEVARAVMDVHAVRVAKIALVQSACTGREIDAAIGESRTAAAHILHEVAQLTSLGFRWLETDGAK